MVRALEPHVEALHRGVHLGALLDLAWALGAMGRCDDAQALLSAVPRRDPTVRLSLTLARAGWF